MLPLGLPAHAPFDPFLLLVVALALDWAVGEMDFLYSRVPHPVVIIGRAIAALEARLNRPSRPPQVRRQRGVVILVVVAGGAGLVGLVIQAWATVAGWAWVLNLLLTVSLIAQRSLYDHVKAVADALEHEGLSAGRRMVARIVGRDPDQLDAHGVARAAVESCAENFSDGVVAPVFWAVLFGLPGLCVYKAVNTLDSMIGHRTDRYRDFGWASARFDDLVNLVPARLAGLLLCAAAALVPGASPGQALKVMARDAGKHRSPNAGWPEAATAGGLGVALAGPRVYPGHVVNDAWIGAEGTARLTVAHIRAALRLMMGACLLLAGLVVAVWLGNAWMGGWRP